MQKILFVCGLVFLLLTLVGQGQERGFGVVGELKFAGYLNGYPIYQIGNGILFVPKDPSLINRFRELEDQTVGVTMRGK